jgi:hypothetical protein
MASHRCHFIECSLYVFVVNIALLSSCALSSSAQAGLYKTGPPDLSSTFFNSTFFKATCSTARASPVLEMQGEPVELSNT